jgi:hypothetical protein
MTVPGTAMAIPFTAINATKNPTPKIIPRLARLHAIPPMLPWPLPGGRAPVWCYTT